MASIERTAYPRLKSNFTKSELRDFYTPTEEEIVFVRQTARKAETQLHLLIHLKLFERLGYFPNIEDVPESIVRHLRQALHLSPQIIPVVIPRTLYRHHTYVREFLNVKAFDKNARRLITQTIFEAAQVMDNPADLINAAIESLIKERFELPAYGTLDRLARRVRLLVNRRFWETISARLSAADFLRLDELLMPDVKAFRTPYNALKTLPKKPTLKHLQEMLNHLEWLNEVGNFEAVLKDIPPLKIKHFAAEAKALDAGEIKDFNEPKRYALLICLIHRAHARGAGRIGADVHPAHCKAASKRQRGTAKNPDQTFGKKRAIGDDFFGSPANN